MKWLRIELGSEPLDIIFRDLDGLAFETYPQRQIFEPFDHHSFLIARTGARSLTVGGLSQLPEGGDGLSRRFTRMIGAAHPPAILARLPAFQDSPRPGEGSGDIAIPVCQPDAAGAEGYGAFIDLLPGLIAGFPRSSDPLPNHQEALAFGAGTSFSQLGHHVSTTAFLKGGSFR
jgi:hypothetical protein